MAARVGGQGNKSQTQPLECRNGYRKFDLLCGLAQDCIGRTEKRSAYDSQMPRLTALYLTELASLHIFLFEPLAFCRTPGNCSPDVARS